MTSDDVVNRFVYHPPKNDQTKRYEHLRATALHLASEIERECPPSHETSLALDHLETAVMFANAAIARHE
jgi:hypothetical protein